MDGQGGGNQMTSAVAVDYDLWRNYGLLTPHSLSMPGLTNPDTQLAPYAAMLLSIARKNILKGNLVIAGNEFMQPGEVIFIESFGLLYYVEKVTHNFSYGQQFQTTLELSYRTYSWRIYSKLLRFNG